MDYVCGYMVSPDRNVVALIWKKRPDWQHGKLNGIGGKKEPEDAVLLETMRREFEEETGVWTAGVDWDLFAITYGPCTNDKDDFRVYYFRAFSDKIKEVTSKTDEQVIVLPINQVSSYPQVNHNRWLLPMVLDCPKGVVYHIHEQQT